MNRRAYYESLQELARNKLLEYSVDTSAFGLREVRRIYKKEQIHIDHWPLPRKIKALYMCADGYCSVALQQKIPDEPKLFALVHELKHHYCDREALGSGVIHCGDYDQKEFIEKGAEVFAAEFIYPQAEFAEDFTSIFTAAPQPAQVVEFKRACKAKISYRFICKRLERLGIINVGEFDAVHFQKLEDQIHGVPFYRRNLRRKQSDA